MSCDSFKKWYVRKTFTVVTNLKKIRTSETDIQRSSAPCADSMSRVLSSTLHFEIYMISYSKKDIVVL